MHQASVVFHTVTAVFLERGRPQNKTRFRKVVEKVILSHQLKTRQQLVNF